MKASLVVVVVLVVIVLVGVVVATFVCEAGLIAVRGGGGDGAAACAKQLARQRWRAADDGAPLRRRLAVRPGGSPRRPESAFANVAGG